VNDAFDYFRIRSRRPGKKHMKQTKNKAARRRKLSIMYTVIVQATGPQRSLYTHGTLAQQATHKHSLEVGDLSFGRGVR